MDPGFWSGGAQQSFDPRGALSPKFAQNTGFPLIACMMLGKSWGQGAPGSAGGRTSVQSLSWVGLADNGILSSVRSSCAVSEKSVRATRDGQITVGTERESSGH